MADQLGMVTHLAGQALRTGWYVGLHRATDRVTNVLGRDLPRVRASGPVPTSRAMLEDVANLFLSDARNVSDGIYPSPEGEDGPMLRQLQRAVAMFADLPEAIRRRRSDDNEEVARQPAAKDLPDYFTRNFHYQSGGYLTDKSARLYDVQVETLFMGSANAMRRQALRPLAEMIRGRDQRQLSLVDIACGTGRFIDQLRQAFPAVPVTGIDLSLPYLREAGRFLRRRRSVRLMQANAEALPFQSDSQDAATCIFLFHELPGDVRRRVAREMARVLKPGGILVFIDSLQTGDRPVYDGLLEVFPAKFHEPYYEHYLGDDVSPLFEDAGLAPVSSWTAFMSKVVVCRKP